MRIYTGTGGLMIAMTLYGQGVVRSVGDYDTPAEIEIPDEDVEAFNALASEEEKNVQSRVLKLQRLRS